NWVLTLGNPHIATPELSLRPQVDRVSSAHAVRRAAADPKDRAALAALPGQVREIASRLPFEGAAQALSEAAPAYAHWLKDALAHPTNDAFWAESGIDVSSHFDDYADLPVLHVTGAYDSWAGSVTAAFQALSQRLKSPQRLLFGPWTHGAQAFSFSGMAEFGPAAAIDLREVERRWFDRWLREEANGAERDPQIEVFVMGGGDGHRTKEGRVLVGGRWERASDWPPKGSRPISYFLHADGRLSTERASAAPPSSFRSDPSDPVPSIGGNVSSQGPLMRAGAFDQRMRKDLWPCRSDGPLSERPDVLSFETEPLDRPVEIFGPIIARLWVASDAPDTDFTAKLVDVWPPSPDFPDGLALNISDGIVRAMWRRGEEEPERLEPGVPVSVVIWLYPTALRFETGHRIRLDVSSSNFPRFDVNPNTGALPGENEGWRVAVNEVFHDPSRPSSIGLPVIERWD
ncbi:MAG: CocE/NonD family hydrolase, partial [Caulobacteraceae bacterium]